MSLTGDRIHTLRQQKNLTLKDVARCLGVGPQAVFKYEQGTVTNIPLESIEKMATLFGVSPCYLAGWNESVVDIQSTSLDSNEVKLVSGYRSLSPHGQKLLLDRCEELKLLHGKKPEDSSANSV